jgi:hypothetical protein
MAKVSFKSDLPQIPLPVGSKEELAELGIRDKDLRNIATCSQHEAFNLGCLAYENCDRAWRNTRPQTQVFEEVKPDGSMRRGHAPCFFIVQRELVAEQNGGLVEIVGGEGDTYMGRGSVRRHPKPDPGCIACGEHRCTIYDDKDDIEVECKPFPPAAEHRELRKYARIVRANVERKMRSQVNKRKALLRDEEPDGNAAKPAK